MPITRYLPEAKSTNYLPAVMALRQARRLGAVEALYVDAEGRVSEGTTSNLFVIREGILSTPVVGALPGITRRIVMALAKESLTPEERDIYYDELSTVEEMFITSTSKEIMPVVQVDGLTIGNGRPGHHTRWLMRKFRELVEQLSTGGENSIILEQAYSPGASTTG